MRRSISIIIPAYNEQKRRRPAREKSEASAAGENQPERGAAEAPGMLPGISAPGAIFQGLDLNDNFAETFARQKEFDGLELAEKLFQAAVVE